MNISKITCANIKKQNFCAKTRTRDMARPRTPNHISYRRLNQAKELKIEDYAFEAAVLTNLVVENARNKNISLEEAYSRLKAAMPYSDCVSEAAQLVDLVEENAKKRNVSLEDEYLRMNIAMPLVKKAARSDNPMLTYDPKRF